MYALRFPAPELAPFVENYWSVSPDDGPVDLRVDVFVDARADLVFNHGAGYRREVIGGRARTLTRSNFDAQRTEPIRIVQRGLVHTTGVRFRLGGVAPFTTVPLDRLTGTTSAPTNVFGPGARDLDTALAKAPDIDARARLLDRFLLARLRSDPGLSDFAAALGRLSAPDGAPTLDGVATDLGLTLRQLERLFARHLGLAPKPVARILRFQSALRRLMTDPGVSLATIADACGYFDQSHFVRDFRRFSGGVPRGYRGYYPPAGPNDFAPNVVVFVQDAKKSRRRS